MLMVGLWTLRDKYNPMILNHTMKKTFVA
jgi:hypothetical protein